MYPISGSSLSPMTQELVANNNPYSNPYTMAELQLRADLDKRFEAIAEAIESGNRVSKMLGQRVKFVAEKIEQSLQEKPMSQEEKGPTQTPYVYCKTCHNTETCHAENMAVVEAKKQETLAQIQANGQEAVAQIQADSAENIAQTRAEHEIQVAKLHGRMNSGDKLIAVAVSCLSVALVCVIVVFGGGNAYNTLMEKKRAFENGYEQQYVPAQPGSTSGNVLWVKAKTTPEPKQPDMKLELPDHGAR